MKISKTLLKAVSLLLLATMFASVPVMAADVHSDGYTFGVSEETFNERIDVIQDDLFLGSWGTTAIHMQGFTVDDDLRYAYASFETFIAKIDLETGEAVGTVGNWYGHMGDLAYYDGRVYGAIYYAGYNAAYIAIIECDKVTQMDTPWADCAYAFAVKEEAIDSLNTLGLFSKNGTPIIDGHNQLDAGHAYGLDDIDGLAVGPIPGDDSGEMVLMVSCGIYLAYGKHTDAVYNSYYSQDRNYQVLLQYSFDSFLESDGNGGTKVREDVCESFHQWPVITSGPDHEEKYFVYTGNARYGAQSVEYDSYLDTYVMAMYTGIKPYFPNYNKFYIDMDYAPQVEDLDLGNRTELYKTMPNSNKGCTNMAQGKVLHLKDLNGNMTDEATGIAGSHSLVENLLDATTGVWDGNSWVYGEPSVGTEHLYGDMYYIGKCWTGPDDTKSSASIRLWRYDAENDFWAKYPQWDQ